MNGAGYAAPRSLQEALSLLAGDADARVLAGGHRLLIEPNRSRLAGKLLVDLKNIPDMARIDRLGDGSLLIGAMVTLSNVAANPTIHDLHPILSDAARLGGDAQFRNRATVGGTLAGPDPQSDLLPLLLAIETTVDIAGGRGQRQISAEALLSDSTQALRPGEVITAVTLAAQPVRCGVAYETQRHPATLGALCGAAAAVVLARDGTVATCRVALTGAAARPVRLPAVEAVLMHTRQGDATRSTAADVAGDGAEFRDDLFASADYRRHLARVFTSRAIRRALERASASAS